MALAFLILPLFFITVIYQNQVKATVKLTGVKTFSAFSGWLLANNAFHIYPFVKIDTGKISDPEVKQFVEYVLANDSMPVLDKYNTSTQFMWSPQFPLKKYLFAQMRERGGNYLNTFTYLGANVYNGFANYVILHYPVEFLRYFILPNFYGVLYPRLDDICSGFKGDVILKDQLQQWFDVDPQTNFLANSTIVEKMSAFNQHVTGDGQLHAG